jgi:hypothetical protein
VRRASPLVAALALAAAASPAGGGTLLRYRLAPGQVWRATVKISRETQLGRDVERDGGTAHVEYRVEPADTPGQVALEARMLRQETSAGASPFDFSVIHYHATADARGVAPGAHFDIGEAEPPDIEGVDRDPVAFRQLLRSVASAWLESVYWLPRLPEEPLEVGASFTLDESEPVDDLEPGIEMRMKATRSYTLEGVSDGLAHFTIRVRSRVDAATARGSLQSARSGRGEAVFDLARGMWRSQTLRDEHRARYHDAPGLGDGETTAHSVTEIEMALAQPASGAGTP